MRDFENDQIFDGYDPVSDGFAYAAKPHALCACTIIPPTPGSYAIGVDMAFRDAEAHICSFCLTRLRGPVV